MKLSITKNLPVKVICLLVAAGLWLFVSLTQSTISKFPGTIHIKSINQTANLVAVYDEKEVQIQVMAGKADWQKLSADSFSAFIDLSGLTEGTHQVAINVIPSVPGVTVVSKNPDKILVSLERVITKEVPVTKKIEGQAADGYVAGAVTFSPATVQIRGALSLVGNINEATATIILKGQSNDYTSDVALSVLDDQGSAMQGIEITPSEASADISVVKGADAKTLGITPKITGVPKDGYYISDISITPSVVEVTGARNILSDIKSIETVPVDVSNSTTDIDKDVALTIPDGVSLIGTGNAKAHLKISISNIQVQKELSVSTIRPLNLGGFSISSYSPVTLKVTCQGSLSAISALTDSDLTLNLDFTGHTPNQSREIAFTLTPGMISAPSGISILSVDPSELTVKIN